SQHGTDRAQFLELVEDQAERGPDLVVGVQRDALATADVAYGDAGEQRPASGLVHPPQVHPLADQMEFGLAHEGPGNRWGGALSPRDREVSEETAEDPPRCGPAGARLR